MKVSVLSSGSKGNCTLIDTKKTKILIDLGVTKSYLEEKLKEIKVDPYEISAILITHTHVDHVQGLKVFLKKYHPKLYVNKVILSILNETLDNFDYELYETPNIVIEDINITVIKTSHDAKGSVGFILENNDKTVVYITDTGYINEKYFDKLKNHSMYIIESNHDTQMLLNGTYPYYLKRRILGDKGHLSNKDTAFYLSKFIGNNTNTIILAHLSDDNNTYDLALNETKKIIDKRKSNVKKIIVAEQKKRTDFIEV